MNSRDRPVSTNRSGGGGTPGGYIGPAPRVLVSPCCRATQLKPHRPATVSELRAISENPVGSMGVFWVRGLSCTRATAGALCTGPLPTLLAVEKTSGQIGRAHV